MPSMMAEIDAFEKSLKGHKKTAAETNMNR